MPPVTKWLLISNLVIFLIDASQRGPNEMYGPINAWGCFNVAGSVFGGRIWEFVTFQFLHATFGHVLFNCIGIYFFAPFVERWWGSRKFFMYYLLSGVGGGLFYTLLLQIGLLPASHPAYSNLVGASAGLFGVLFAIYRLAPASRIQLLIPPVEMSMKTMAIVLGSIAVLTIVGGLLFPDVRLFWNSGGEAGHLGGAIMGWVLMTWPWLLGKGKRPGSNIVRPKEFRRRMEPKLKPRSRIDPTEATEVDRILDKVSAQGFGSLTDEEKATLEQASRDDG